MATVTADFSTASGGRSRVERITDGVVAEYIRALDGAAARTRRMFSSEQDRVIAADSSLVVTASRGQRHGPLPRPTSSRSRGGRGGCPNQVDRLLEAR